MQISKKAIVFGVFIILLIGFGMGKSPDKKTGVVSPVQVSPTATPAPTQAAEVKADTTDEETINAVYRAAFVEGCSQSGKVSEAQCRCMFNVMLEKYGVEKMIEAANSEGSGSPIYIEAAASCYKVK